jgi:adenosylhomocysteine nucleosidase
MTASTPEPSEAPVAVVSAMHEELRALVPQLADVHRVTRAGREFHCGRLHGQAVVLVLSGIGKVAAATTVSVLASEFRPRSLLFTGVAGGLAAGVRVGDVVLARELLQHDMDASPLFPRYEVPMTGRSRFAAGTALSDRLAAAALHCLAHAPRTLDAAHLAEFGIVRPRLHEGLVISGDRFVATAAESAALRSALPDALAVEMEGAAVAQVCADFGLPFALLRVISDRADDSAHHDFLRFTREVASVLTRLIVGAALTLPAPGD